MIAGAGIRRRLFFCLAALAMLFLAAGIGAIQAYAHGISSCFSPIGGCALRGWGEQYSSNSLDMSDSSRNVLIINDTVENLYRNREMKVVPYASVDASNSFGSRELSYLLRSYYPLYNDPASWYVKVESNVSLPLVIGPGERVGYEIRVYPLKAGTYHIHSLFVFDYMDDGRYSYYERVGRGQTVTVDGPSDLTMGEITQLFLPLAIGAAIIPIAALKASKAAESNKGGRIRQGIRLYFAAKASLETVWLAGLLVWFFSVAYPAFHPLESRVLSVAGMIALIAAITTSGYIAALAKSRKLQSNFAIGTAIASFLFYSLLNIISLYAWMNGSASFYNLLPSSGVGYQNSPFEISYPAYLVGLFANPAVAIMSALTRKEKYNTKVIAAVAAGTAVFAIFVMRILQVV